jgi:hypothetical protein
MVPNISTNTATVRVSADSGATYLGLDVSNGNFNISLSPGAVVTPNGGESLQGLRTHEITWNARPSATSYTLYYSVDGGSTWIYISSVGAITSYTWMVPSISTSAGRVRISAANGATYLGLDVSNGDFSITPGITPGVVTSPNGGETLTGLITHNITWTARPSATRYSLYYSINGGSTWNFITEVGAVTSYPWVPPNLNSTTAKVRVSASNGETYLGLDVSDGDFNINLGAPIVIQGAVTSPNGGETLTPLSEHDIVWNPRLGATSYALYYSADGGTTWVYIGPVGDVTSYSWRVPNLSTTNARVRVSAFNGGTYLGIDASDGDFVIAY